MRKLIFALFVAAGLIGAALPDTALAEATRAQCSCDHEAKGDKQHGATVANASACFLTENENNHWCSFDVDALEGSSRQQEFLLVLRGQVGTGAAEDVILSRLTEYRTAPDVSERLKARGFDTASAVDRTQSILKDNNDLLNKCLGAFVDLDPGEFAKMAEGDGLACGVNAETGWLNLEFRFDGWKLLYLTEPPVG
ncbi:hypothetical protein SAMN05444358_1011108 [Ruegeria halocynthiae]|uniref:Uncharacterized protein n=1 Tax=Ruegeria halocynthiae TaxID=985054 RepID=A0A1H2UFQ0_9RHOB|nr:hypothetical protein [Ruegeria halocynthiae]SDW54379.1 hypothetical protein SAMN05444358_1011108 [Ruegeria halocynthiae]